MVLDCFRLLWVMLFNMIPEARMAAVLKPPRRICPARLDVVITDKILLAVATLFTIPETKHLGFWSFLLRFARRRRSLNRNTIGTILVANASLATLLSVNGE